MFILLTLFISVAHANETALDSALDASNTDKQRAILEYKQIKMRLGLDIQNKVNVHFLHKEIK